MLKTDNFRRALLVWGGWPGHEPQACAELFAPFLRDAGFAVEIADTLDTFLDREKLAALDLIVPVWTLGEIASEQLAGLLGAVRAGCGLAGWHGGMGDSFRTACEYQFMVGGQFVGHPGGIVDYQVNIVAPDDPITAGLADFSLRSEQYYLHVDPSNEVLATTIFSGAHGDSPWVAGTVMPTVWKRRYGAGRVFYSALGHVAADLEIPAVRALTERGLLWAARTPL